VVSLNLSLDGLKKMGKIYTIKKNNHSSGFHLGLTFKNSIKFSARFLDGCLYKIDDNDKYDINKLFGFSTSYFHHKNSARLGWRCNDENSIDLFAYVYVNSKRVDGHIYICTVELHDEFECEIIDTESSFVFKVKTEFEDHFHLINIEKKWDWFLFHYYLYPYFGGNKTAPHDMKMIVEIIK